MNTTTEILHIPLARLVLSQTPMQQERRKHRTPQDIKELAESITSVGQIHPIVVRPAKIISTPGLNGLDVAGKTYFSPDEAEEAARNTFEIVAGEGRYLGAEAAGVDAIRAELRDLSDEQVEEIQLIENLQRKGLHELVEAEGYEALQKRGHTAEEIAIRTGKSKATVYARMKLLDLCTEARKAFRDGKISASIALLLARIPVADLQKQAFEEVLESDRWTEPMSYRQASEHIQRNYMLRLKEAPFPVGDLNLVPGAGACATCPKNTAMQRELFADVEKASAGVCTDPVCFKSKRAAWGTQQLATAQASGQKVIDGAAAKKIAKNEHSLHGGFVKLTDHCHVDPKYRTYGEIIGKKLEPTLLRMPQSGEVIAVVNQADVKELLPKWARSSNDSHHQQQSTQEKKRRAELDYRAELFRRVQAAGFEADAEKDLRLACEAMFDRLHHDGKVRLFKVMGWTVTERKDKYRGTVKTYDHAAVLKSAKTASDLWKLLRALSVAGDLECYSFGTKERSDRLHTLAARVGVSAKKVEAELVAAAKAKAPAKVAKKKAAKSKR